MSTQISEPSSAFPVMMKHKQTSQGQQDGQLHQDVIELRHSPAAINQAWRSHAARGRRAAARARLEAEKAEARALGVEVIDKPPAADRRWIDAEDNVIREMASATVREIQLKLPHRSAASIEKRRFEMNLGQKRNYWSSLEIEILKKNANKSSMDELCCLLPKRTSQHIHAKCSSLGIRRGPPPLQPTGHWLCDEIRDRCRVLGYSAAQLDAMAKTGTYFQMRSWKQRSGHLWLPMVKAAKLLGGELRVEWPD